jgi:3-deoxy-D-manno-octulosonic acid kinase
VSDPAAARGGRQLALPAGFAWYERAGCLVALDPEWRDALEAAGLLDPRSVRTRLAEASDPRGRAPIAVVEAPPQSERIALRGFRRGGWLGPMLGARLAGPARPFRELVATARLRAAGAPVPRPLFALAWRHGITWNAALGTAYVEDAIDAAALLARAPSRERLHVAIRAAGRALRRFHDAGGWHPDLHLGNLLVRERGDAPEVLILDLDGARADAVPAPAQRMEQLMRLLRSVHKRGLWVAAGRDRASLRFLHAYVAGDRALRAALLAHLPAERRRLARHALLYR